MSNNIAKFTNLRGFALIAVSMFHIFPHIFRGGFLGVVIFFSLSGFLMSQKFSSKNSITFDKISTYSRIKARKLYMPLFFVMFVSLLITYIFSKIIFSSSVENSIGVMLNIDNILRILKEVSYFDQHGNFNMFNHLWTMPMQVQFLLVFFAVEYTLSKLSIKGKITKDNIPNYRKKVYIALSLISILDIIFLSISKMDINRIYYGTDARIHAFTMGILSNIIFLPYVTRKFNLDDFLGSSFHKISKKILILVILLLSIFTMGESYITYMAIIPIFTILLNILMTILYFEHQNNYDNNITLFEARAVLNIFLKVINYLGKRSYYIYLWQYIINTLIVYNFSNSTINKYILGIIVFLISIGFSELTSIALNKIYEDLKYIRICLAFCLIGILILNILPRQKKSDDYSKHLLDMQQTIQNDISKDTTFKTNTSIANTNNILNQKDIVNLKIGLEKQRIKSNNYMKEIIPKRAFNFTQGQLDTLKDISITAIGDSVIINAYPYLQGYFKEFYLDAKVNRQMYEGANTLILLNNHQKFGDIILVALGTNGDFNKEHLDNIRKVVNNKPIIFVTTVMPDSFEESVNNKLRNYAKENENVYIADWYALAKQRSDLFVQDKTHPEIKGSKLYAGLIADTVLKVYEDKNV